MQRLTSSAKLKEITREWLLIDAKDQILGRLSTKVSRLLSGKDKSYYSPNLDCGDFVVVINAKNIKVTGDKANQKKYYRYSGYPGGLKETNLEKLRKEKPEEVFKHAVWGMLPKGKLGREILKKLYIYPGETHPHEAQKPREVKE